MAGFGLFKRLVGGGDRRHHLPRVRAAASTRVLVVDDSATIRAVLGKMLNQDGYEVLKAADGASALALARSEHPDLVFLDIVMPGVSGFEVLRTLRREQATAHVPIVMISGNVQATEQFYVQRYGADDFMKKPFGREEVFERIRQLVQAGRLPARAEAAPVLAPAEEVVAPPGGVSQDEWDAIPDIALPDAAYGEHKPHDLHGLHELPADVPASPQAPQLAAASAASSPQAGHVAHAASGLDGPVPPSVHGLDGAHASPASHGIAPSAPELHAAEDSPLPPAAAPASPVTPASHPAPHAVPAPLQASLPLPEPPAAAVPPAPPVVPAPAVAPPVTHAPVTPLHPPQAASSPAQSALAWLASRARVLAPASAKPPEQAAGAGHSVESAHAEGSPPEGDA